MAKLTVYFKDQQMKSYLFETGRIRIGRDNRSDIIIDSLDVAPAHAIIRVREHDCAIRQLHEDFPLLINDRPTVACYLTNDDRITLGRFHSIVYNATEFAPKLHLPTLPIDPENLVPEPQIANLQIVSGPNIGKILPVRTAITRLGTSGKGVVAIAKRKDGFFVSVLEGNDSITVNKEPLKNSTIKLNNGDVINVDHTTAKFFLG